jgi:hypothetical protein
MLFWVIASSHAYFVKHIGGISFIGEIPTGIHYGNFFAALVVSFWITV